MYRSTVWTVSAYDAPLLSTPSNKPGCARQSRHVPTSRGNQSCHAHLRESLNRTSSPDLYRPHLPVHCMCVSRVLNFQTSQSVFVVPWSTSPCQPDTTKPAVDLHTCMMPQVLNQPKSIVMNVSAHVSVKRNQPRSDQPWRLSFGIDNQHLVINTPLGSLEGQCKILRLTPLASLLQP